MFFEKNNHLHMFVVCLFMFYKNLFITCIYLFIRFKALHGGVLTSCREVHMVLPEPHSHLAIVEKRVACCVIFSQNNKEIG